MDSSLQHLVEQLQQKKAQAESSLMNLQMESLFHTSTFYNYIIHKLNCLINAGSSIPDPDSYIREEIAKASVLYQKPLTTLVSQAFNLQAIFPFIGENHENADSQPVNNQEEMSGGVQNADENARQLAQQPIINTLPPNFNQAVASQNDSLDVSIKREADESMPVNERESYSHDDDEADVKSEEDYTQYPCIDISSDDEAGGQNGDDDSLDVSIKREVDSSSESECESDTDDDEEVQVKEEPNEQEEDITARSQEQTENAINSDDNREIGRVYAEDDGDGNLEEDERIDNMETEENDLYDRKESDNEDSMVDGENAGKESDHFEDQVNMSGVEDNDDEENDEDYLMSDENSSDDTTDDDDAEDEQAAGPSTSTGRRSTRQIMPGRQSNGPNNVKKTEKLSVITLKLKCTVPGCKKVVLNKSAMNSHLLTAHKLKEFRCLVRRCYGKVSTSFTTKSQLNDHRDQVHGSRTKWTCKCSKKLKSYQELSTHYWKYHQLGRFACSKDGCTFKPTRTRGKVLNHQAKHREANYECPVGGCDRSFKWKGNLDRHLLTHTGERPFVCTECDKSFTQKSTLTVHLRIHRNHKCYRCTWPECTHSATSRGNVIVHIRMVHFKLPQTKKQQAEERIEDDRDPSDYLARD